MSKRTKKRYKYNKEVVERLQEKYGLSVRFITMSLNGDRISETSTRIIEDYKKMVLEVEFTLRQL